MIDIDLGDYRDYSEYEEEYQAKIIDEAIEELPADNIRWYLGTYGDEIEKRVNSALKTAKYLNDNGMPGPSLSVSATAIEIVLRFFILRPLVHGAFLSNDWSEVLLDKVIYGSTCKDRELIPKITKHWGVNIEEIKLNSDKFLWPTLLRHIWPIRNNYVHKYDDISETDAGLAIECIQKLMDEVVIPFSSKVGLNRKKIGIWHKAKINDRTIIYLASNPFICK